MFTEIPSRKPEPPYYYRDKEAALAFCNSTARGPMAFAESFFARTLLKKHGSTEKLAVADIGTGPGWVPIQLALARPCWKITAVDVSPNMLDIARKNSAERNVEINWTLGKAEDTGLPSEQFDLIISHLAFSEFPDPIKSLAEMVRIGKNGGRIEIGDLLRPSKLMMPIIKSLGFFHPREMKKQYHSSLEGAFTLQELRDLVASNKNLQEVRIVRIEFIGGLISAVIKK